MTGLSRRVKALVREDIQNLVPYDPNFTPCDINLSANENSYGMPQSVRRAINNAFNEVATNRYPDPMANELRDELAAWYGINRMNVCVGNGGDELIFNLFLAFGGPGKVLLDCPPSFTVYATYASMLGMEVRRSWRDAETFDVNLDDLVQKAASADITIVTSPNNPTGNTISREQVAQICRSTKGIVLIDEAYVEFSGPSTRCDMLLATYDNLVILHTFSKAFSMAGVRVGYVLAASDVIDVFAAVRQPYTVDVFAQAAALAAIKRRGDFNDAIEKLLKGRDELICSLEDMPHVKVWPSEANFILVRLPEAARVRARLRDEFSILVRDFSSAEGLENCLRITVGTSKENARLLEAMSQILKEA